MLCLLAFLMLLGMNGGGKSTLFKTLALAQNVPMSGSVSIAGKDIIDNIWDIGSVNGLGYVPQEGGLLEYLTVRQTIKLFTLLRCQNDNYRSDNNVDRFKAFRTLKDSIIQKKYLDYPVYALSGGTRKKLAVQISNINSPSLLLFDECTTGVDPIAAERIIRYLKQINTSQGMLFASHRIDESINLCSKVIMLLRGQRYLYGSIKAFNELAYQFFQVDISLNTTSIKRAERNTSRESFTSLSCEEDFTFSESPVRNRSYSTSKSLYRDAFGHGMENDSYQNSAQGFNHSTVSPLMFVDTGVDSIGNKKESNQSLSNSVNDSSQSTQHYQNVDDSTIVNELQRQAQAEFLKRLQQLCGGEENIERIVFYSPLNARITLEKKVISICTIWKHLIHWKKNDYISKYSFRSMDMEEALSTIIASSQGE